MLFVHASPAPGTTTWRLTAGCGLLVLAVALAPAVHAQVAHTIENPDAELAAIEELYRRSEYRDAARRLTLLRSIPGLTSLQRARTLTRLAAAQVEIGEMAQALETADEAEAAARAAGAEPLLIRLEIVRGSVWRFRGFPFQGIRYYEAALALAERLGQSDLRSETLALLSGVHQALGDWSRTLDYAERSYRTRTNPSLLDQFNYFVQRGIALFEFNDRDGARESFERALEAARRMEYTRAESFALGELGLVAWLFDRDYERGLALIERALAIARALEVPVLQVSWLNNSGSVLRDMGRHEAALARYREALALEERMGQRRERPTLLKNLGQVLSAMGRRREAEPVLAQAIVEADRQNSGKIRWMARMEMGDLYREIDPARAARYFEESLGVLEADQSSVLLEGFRAGMLGRALDQYDPYDRYIRFLLDRGEVLRAFSVAERARARVFLETLTAARPELAAAVPDDYLRAETEHLQRISAAQARFRAADLAAGDRKALEAEIDAAEEGLTALRLRLAVERPALAQARFPRVWAADEIRAILEADEALAMFFLGRQASAAWILDRRGVTLVRLPPREEIEGHVRRLLPTLQSPRTAVDEAARTWLFDHLAAPLAARAPEGAHLILVPHAVLHYLPLEALADRTGRYLVERNSVSYAPSVSSFAYLRQRGSPRNNAVLAVGSPAGRLPPAEERASPFAWIGRLKPLPHGRAEIRRIAATFRPASRVLEGRAATEEALGAAPLSELGILHFATHALLDEERPDSSGLALSPGRGASDGILQTREVYRLPLDGTLVTLSACQTAVGREVTGEGLLAMSRAFFFAGASAVTASLWNVNDRSTADLMALYYSRIREGAPFERALADAKRGFLAAAPDRRHPFYWAPFVITGHARGTLAPPAAPTSTGAALVLAAAVVALAAAVIATVRRGRTSAAARA